ncbi:MAG: TonB family protein [Bacteroidetes bacterium]|nr:TonB family protein [Bacteroidota bacterium]
MENKVNFKNETMDDIVFDNRNKEYGAFAIRKAYAKNLLTAIGIAVLVFSFSMYTPAIAKKLGLFKDKAAEKLDTTSVVLEDIKSIKPDEPPPPPPPEVKIEAPTIKFLEIQAVKKEEADTDPPPTKEELEKPAVIDDKTKDGDLNAPPPITPTGGTAPPVIMDEGAVEQAPKSTVDFQEYINNNADQGLITEDINGETQITFVVKADGSIDQSSIRVSKSSGHKDLDNDALKLARKMPRYTPGKNNGKAVDVRCKVKINYTVPEE